MTDPMLYAAVADDDTGASDLAGMLADQGVPTLLILDPAFLGEGCPQLREARAIVLATASRALPRRRAFDVTAEAVRMAATLGPRTVQIKYCSTFDSTVDGNIGPSLDAAAEVLSERYTIALPALPVNGRTTYCGYHFVNGQLLSDSPMRHHPLTPMANSNLVEHLQAQTSRRVGLTACPVVAKGDASIRQQWAELRDLGTEIAVVDCIDGHQAAAIAEAACDLRLVSGSSVLGTYLPAAWRRRGWLDASVTKLRSRPDLRPGCGRLVIAGSCSQATAAQNEWLAQSGAAVIELETRHLIECGSGEVAGRAAAELGRDGTVLLKTRSGRDDIAAVQQWGKAQAWTPAELGLRISGALATLTRQIVDLQLPEALVCAGGETTGAICRALSIRAFHAGRNIQPGIPLCFPMEGPRVPMVLKSGNFGTTDFYGAAFAAAFDARNGATI